MTDTAMTVLSRPGRMAPAYSPKAMAASAMGAANPATMETHPDRKPMAG